jgi:hypothetical protein
MTDNEVKHIIKLAIPPTATNADEVAEAILKKALHKIARRTDVTFNQKVKAFNLTNGTADYKFGADIFTSPNDNRIWNMQELHRTDVQGWPIPIVGVDEFNFYSAGGTTTGAPYVATLHSDPIVLSVYPIPDSNYAVEALVRESIASLGEVPERYHDIVASYAAAFAKMIVESGQGRGSDKSIKDMADEDFEDLKHDGPTGWSGSVFQVEQPLGDQQTGVRVDSGNLRP